MGLSNGIRMIIIGGKAKKLFRVKFDILDIFRTYKLQWLFVTYLSTLVTLSFLFDYF